MGRRPHLPAASSGKPAHPLHLSLCHEPAVKKSKGNKNAIKKEKNRAKSSGILLHFCNFNIWSIFAFLYLSYWGLCDKIFKWIFWSDCCEVFVQNTNFLLVIPSGWTKEKEKIFKLLFKNIWRQMPAQTVCQQYDKQVLIFGTRLTSFTYMNTASFSTTKAGVTNWKSYSLCTIYL